MIPNIALSRPVNTFGLFTTTIFITVLLSKYGHSLSRKTPITTSRTAITNSITRSEKNDRHITAPRNAATARIRIRQGLFPRFFGCRMIPLLSLRICNDRNKCAPIPLLNHFIRFIEIGDKFGGGFEVKVKKNTCLLGKNMI